MILVDVNVLVYAFRKDADHHREYRRWLVDALEGDSAFGMSEQVLSSFVRVTTHPRVFRHPTPLKDALSFAQTLRDHPLCRLIRSGDRHWPIFARLCTQAGARANLITDAWHAALAIESGSVWITADRDFARFPGLQWKHPLDHAAVIENPG